MKAIYGEETHIDGQSDSAQAITGRTNILHFYKIEIVKEFNR